MFKPFRLATTALFIMGVFCLASCNRNWCDCFCSPCSVKSAQSCGPCSPCAPACDNRGCQPSCQPCGPQRCVQPCPAPCGSCPKPCPPEQNPYFPCDPSFAPCGGPSGCGTPPGDPKCYGDMTTYATCDDCVVDLCQVAPSFATVGSAYPIQITITARKECAQVHVTQKLPCGAMFISSEPGNTPNAAGELVWDFPHMTRGECQSITIWVKPEKEGCCLAEATICACPQLCAYTKCGQPVVCIKKCGPACACLYCPVPYRIDVSNSGSATAYNVVVQDTIPDGLTHASGYSCLTYELGDLCPGQSKTINLDLCAVRPGTVTNVATVSYCGGPKCSAEATTIINRPCVEVTKTGADWAYICKEVDYTITVTNPGDLVLRDVVVDDVSASGTTVVDAPGATVCCNRATWCISELCPGTSKTFTVSVKSQVAGNLTNKVTVTSQSDCGPCTQCAEATTLWKGLAATHMCMVDTVDPICVGDTTVYRICVTNRGTADDTNVSLSVKFSNELQPQSINGPTRGTISGNTVTFAPLDRLSTKQSVEYSITVKGVAVGDARAEASLSSDALSIPSVDTESTHVY